jgi:hypothetical protein
MKASKFSDEQLAMAWRQVKAGHPVGEICRKLRVTERSLYRWRQCRVRGAARA